MTATQRSYLQTLAQEAQQLVDDHLTKAEASKEIEHLQQATGRGTASKKPRNAVIPGGHRPVKACEAF